MVIALPATGLFTASVNLTLTAGIMLAPAVVSDGCPTNAIVCAAPPILVRMKVAASAIVPDTSDPDTFAVTGYGPAIELAVA
jgi:hypothetical protein